MNHDTKFFADLFVATARSEAARRSYAKGISTGTGHIPFDTGATQHSIYVSRVSESGCTIEIGNEAISYVVLLQNSDNVGNTCVPNKHKGFVEKFARTDFYQALRREFGKVEIT